MRWFGFFSLVSIPSKLYSMSIIELFRWSKDEQNCFYLQRKNSTPQTDKKCLRIFFMAHRSPLYFFSLYLPIFFSRLLTLSLSRAHQRTASNNKSKKISDLYQVWYNEPLVLVCKKISYYNDTFHWFWVKRRRREKKHSRIGLENFLWLMKYSQMIDWYSFFCYYYYYYWFCCYPMAQWPHGSKHINGLIEFHRHFWWLRDVYAIWCRTLDNGHWKFM